MEDDESFIPLQDRSSLRPPNSRLINRMNSTSSSMDSLQMTAIGSVVNNNDDDNNNNNNNNHNNNNNKRREDGMKNRPLHELLNYDDDDHIVHRTQFEMDTNPDSRNNYYHNTNHNTSQSQSQSRSNPMRASFSTLGTASIYDGGDDHITMTNRFSGLSSTKITLLALTTCLLICLIGIVTVALILVGPQFDNLHRHHSDHHTNQQTIDGPEADLLKLKQSSTIEHLKYGAVASDHSICSSLGHHILNVDNGNVVDAAVATALCLGIANPASSGLGGGMFMVIHIDADAKDVIVNTKEIPSHDDLRDDDSTTVRVDENGKTTLIIDAREVAPIYANKDMFEGLANDASTMGGLAMAVPGELKGLELAHAMFGKLSWTDVVNPAIKLARHGVPVSTNLAHSIMHHAGQRWVYQHLRKLISQNSEGVNPLQAGNIMQNEALASFLESVRNEGSAALYDGSHTAAFLEDVNKMGSILTKEDLNSYKATIRSPLVAKDVFGYTMVGVPPPSSGGATVMGAARFLSGYRKKEPLVKWFRGTKDTPPKWHRLTEAMRHAFAIRMSLSDPAFNSAKVTEAVNDLVYNDYMESLRKVTMDDAVLPLSQYGGTKWAQITNDDVSGNGTDAMEGDRRQLRNFGYLEDKGTTSFSIMDNKGNAVSMTSSINTYFGSGIVSPRTGILLNSQMDDFATPSRPNFFGLEPTESNYIQPGKKPLSSMSPMLVFEPTTTTGHTRSNALSSSSSLGEIYLALGGSGGPKIISATLQTFLNHAVEKMDLFHAVASPRIHDQLLYHSKASTLYESTTIFDSGSVNKPVQIELPPEARLELESTGHSLVPVNFAGCVQVVSRDKVMHKFSAVSDSRKGGRPAGL